MTPPPARRERIRGWTCWAAALWSAAMVQAEWPQLRGNPQRTGYTPERLAPPLSLRWSAVFVGERIGTAVEPIVAGGRVFVPTHAGNLYALDADSGAPLWRFAAPGPLLHSPAVHGDTVVVAAAGGGVYGVEVTHGQLRWAAVPDTEGGFAAAPLIAAGRVFLGSRGGRFFCLDLQDGRECWHTELPAPVRQPAAWDGTRVLITAEDLVVRALGVEGAEAGKELWRQPLQGQSARDYPPVVVRGGDGRLRVVVRTSPVHPFAQRLARDRAVLLEQAGVDGSSWATIEAWIKSDAARGTPELWHAEQQAVRAFLQREPEAQTLFVLEAATGVPEPAPPVFWTGGCQGVGNLPAQTAEGPLLVIYRSAYGNWNLGVAPLVALGRLDPASSRLEPLFHDGGRQPPWNTFWGTADEAQGLTVAGPLALLVHQGTLAGFDLDRQHLFPLYGARDTFGGFRNPAWARNEWHGPARGGVAVAQGRVYWITGSRLLCLGPPAPAAAATARTLQAATVPALSTPASPAPELRAHLRAAVAEVIARRWAPLQIEPGLAGGEAFFTHSAEVFQALAWAWPHLGGDPLQARVRAWLAAEWEQHPPHREQGSYDLHRGTRRAYHPPAALSPPPGRTESQPHRFGYLPAVWRYALRTGETHRLQATWPEWRALFEDWEKTGWRLDGQHGDLHANRYFAALLALESLAGQVGDPAIADRARAHTESLGRELVRWWQRAAREGTLGTFDGVAELDRFISQGDALSLRLRPHRHQVALFLDLTPEVAAWLRRQAPEAVARVWETFAALHATWWLVGEERQVHYGENLFDPPDLALGAFQALAWLRQADAGTLARRVDRPFCRADLAYLTKLALALDAAASPGRAEPR